MLAMSGPTPGTVDLGRARLAIAAAFGTQGLVFISLTTRLPRIQDRWDLGELALSGVLLMMVLLAGAGSLVAERLAPRLDSAVVLRAGLLVVAVSVAVVVLAPVKVVFVLALAAYGVGLGLVDATGNMQAVALEHRLGRVVLPSCHGAWTLGGVIGAVLTLATTDVPWSAIALVAVLPLLAAVAPYLPRDHGEAATSTDTDVPWRAIVMVGLALVVFYTVDTAAATWGPVYLDDVFAAPEELVALATLPYLLASGLVRLAGDRLTEQVGAVRLLRVGAAIALVSLVVVVAAPTWQVAVARLHAARLRGRRRRPAELLGGGGARGPQRRPGDPAGAGGRGGGAVQPVQLRRRAARRRDDRARSAPGRCASASRCRWCWSSRCSGWRKAFAPADDQLRARRRLGTRGIRRRRHPPCAGASAWRRSCR